MNGWTDTWMDGWKRREEIINGETAQISGLLVVEVVFN